MRSCHLVLLSFALAGTALAQNLSVAPAMPSASQTMGLPGGATEPGKPDFGVPARTFSFTKQLAAAKNLDATKAALQATRSAKMSVVMVPRGKLPGGKTCYSIRSLDFAGTPGVTDSGVLKGSSTCTTLASNSPKLIGGRPARGVPGGIEGEQMNRVLQVPALPE